MLVNPIFRHDAHLQQILSMIGQGGPNKMVEDGIFISPSFSMGNSIANEKDDYYDFNNPDEYLNAYGVCDNIDQVKKKFAKWFNDPDLRFCVSFTLVNKSDQPDSGGWRWHKWGPYIGTKSPRYEYLFDEGDDIEEVYCYHIYRLLN